MASSSTVPISYSAISLLIFSSDHSSSKRSFNSDPYKVCYLLLQFSGIVL